MEKGFFEHFLYVLYVFNWFSVQFVRYILDFNLYFISDSSWVAPIWPVTTMGCAIRIVIKPKISRSLEKRVISYQLYTQGILNFKKSQHLRALGRHSCRYSPVHLEFIFFPSRIRLPRKIQFTVKITRHLFTVILYSDLSEKKT